VVTEVTRRGRQRARASLRARSAATHEPGLVAQLGRDDGRLGAIAAAGQLATERRPSRLEQQVAGCAHAAADDEGAGVQGSGEVGDAEPQPAPDLGQQLAGERVAVARGLGDERAGEVFRSATDPVEEVGDDGTSRGEQRPGLPHERVAGGVLLPAPPVAALTPDAVGHDLHVPELARDAVPATDDLTVEHDAPADPRAEVDHDEVALAAPGTEAVLGPHRGVGVVVDEGRQRHPAGEGVAQRFVAPGQVWGKDHGRAVGRDEAGGTDADRDDRPRAAVQQLFDDRDDGVLDDARARRPVRGAATGPLVDDPVGVDDPAGHLRAADVDADRQTLLNHWAYPSGPCPVRRR
jgi:hypothetical protein